MNAEKKVRCIRLFLGFLLAPAIVPIWMGFSLDGIIAYIGIEPSDLAYLILGMSILVGDTGLAYLGGLIFGLPYVIYMLRQGQMNFRTLMAATLVMSLMYSVIEYISLNPQYQLIAKPMAILSVPAVILSGLCFYFISFWRLPKRKLINVSQ